MADSNEISLLFGSESVSCNKNILMDNSDYFRAMFSGSFVESTQKEIKIELVDPVIFRNIMNFYDEKPLNLSSENINFVMEVANMFQFTDVMEECDDFVIKSFTDDNCLQLHQDCLSCGPQLKEAAIQFALYKFPNFIYRDELYNLSLEEFVSYMRHENLNTMGIDAEKFLIFIVKYIVKNSLPTEKWHSLYDLIDFTSLRPCLFDNQYRPYIDQMYIPTFKKLVELAMLSPARKLTSGPVRKMKYMPCVVGEILARDRSTGQKLMQYSLIKFDCHKAEEMGFPSTEEKLLKTVIHMHPIIDNQCVGFSVTAFGTQFFVTGGKCGLQPRVWSDYIHIYDTITRKWKSVSAKDVRRRNHSSCVVNYILYLVGGCGSFREKLGYIDCYDISRDIWMGGIRPGMEMYGAVTCAHYQNSDSRGSMYIFIDSNVYEYDTFSESWSRENLKLKPAVSFRHAFSWNGFIYLIQKYSPNVYVYCPRSNSVRKYGTFKHATMNVCQLESKLYNFSDTDSHACNVIEMMEINRSYSKGLLKFKIGDRTVDESLSTESNLATSTEIWRCNQIKERKFVSNTELSFGCFPLYAPY